VTRLSDVKTFFYVFFIFVVFLLFQRCFILPTFFILFFFVCNTCRPTTQSIVTTVIHSFVYRPETASPQITYDNCKIPLSTSSSELP